MKLFSFSRSGWRRAIHPAIIHRRSSGISPSIPRGLLFSRLLLLSFALSSLAVFVLMANSYGLEILSLSMKYPGFDKVAHFIMHAVLVSVAYYSIRRLIQPEKHAVLLVVVVLSSVVLGVLDEVQQIPVPGREFDLLDIMANLCGTLMAALVISLRRGRRRRRYQWAALALLTVTMGLLLSHSHNGRHLYYAGLMHVQHRDWAAARQMFRAAIEKGQAEPALFNELAWIELEFLHTDPAVSLVYTERAVAAQPHNPDFLDTHGWALHMTGRHREALKYLLSAYRADSTIYCINYHLGAVYHALGRYAEARHYLQAQLEKNSQGRFAQYSRQLLGMMDTAITHL